MTEPTKTMRRLKGPLTTILAALALSGCASGHVGEDWQCPLAQGSQCASVAAADPAVRDAAGRKPAPPYRAQDAAGPAWDGNTGGGCDRGCNPLAWLARLFASDAPESADDGTGAGGVGGMQSSSPQSGSSVETAVAQQTQPEMQERPDGARETTTAADPAGDGLRVPETIGRVWIAPYVDGDGVYREGAYVRIVIAPADWRRP